MKEMHVKKDSRKKTINLTILICWLIVSPMIYQSLALYLQQVIRGFIQSNRYFVDEQNNVNNHQKECNRDK